MTESTTNGALMYPTSANPVVEPTGAETPADALGEPKRMSQSESEGQESAECPTCGDTFSTVSGMRKHHAHKHGESLVEPATCKWCGEEIDGHPSGRVFCSFECRGEHRSENGLPARSRQATLVCEGCGEEFDVPRSDAEAGKKYCSMECYVGDSKIQTRECEWCGDEYRGYERRRFCSQDCYGEWVANEMPIEQHPRYKGDDKLTEPNYGEGWNEETREAVRDRDGHCCVACGMDSEEHQDRYGYKLNVHHVVPARESDDPEQRNAMDNLVTLCIPCHRKWEGIPLRPELID